MMKSTASIAMPVLHRHNGTPRRAAATEERSDAQICADVRAFEVKCLFEEMRLFGLEPPIGLKCSLALFIEGRATIDQVQTYLSRHLSDPVSNLETNHA
jgi:hypothetical protein